MIREVKILMGRGVHSSCVQDAAALAEEVQQLVDRLQGEGLTVELQYQHSTGRPSVMVVASGLTADEAVLRRKARSDHLRLIYSQSPSPTQRAA